MTTSRFGPDSSHWKGGRWVTSRGYVMLTVDGREIYEHRRVMELHLGRPLRTEEQVHHRNHDKTDNRVENLEIKDVAAHITDHWGEGFYDARVAAQQRPDIACDDCGEVTRIRGRGLCPRCYMRHYCRAQRAAAGAKVRKTTTRF